MLDISHIPAAKSDTQIFYANGTTGWQTWVKSRNAKFIQIFCLGSGGGGAGGATNAAASTANGGSGAGSAGYTRAIYLAYLIPDTLYIQVANGGAGGAGRTGSASNGTSGTAGAISYVSIAPTTTATSLLLASANTVAPGGVNTGTATTTPAIAWSVASSPFSVFGIISGSNGVVGSNQNIGPTALATNIVTGGAGGASKPTNTQQNGPNITAASVVLLSNVNGGVAGGGKGDDGYGSLIPFCGTGGAGGGSTLTAAGSGGNGGNGWYGCGGGGGGAGISTTGTGGRGGNGGDGLVIITTIT